MRFDPEKEKKKKRKKRKRVSWGISPFPAQFVGDAEGRTKKKSAAGKRVVYQDCLPELFDISSPPVVYNPDTCSSWAGPPRANGQDRRRCGESGQSAAD